MSSKVSRLVPLSHPKSPEGPAKAPTYARLDALLDAREAASVALALLWSGGAENEYTKLLEEKQRSFLELLDQVVDRLDTVLQQDGSCDGVRMTPEHVRFVEYLRDTVASFCGITASLSVAKTVPVLQQTHGKEGWRTMFDAMRSLERLAKKSLAQLLEIGPEKLLPR